MDKRTRVGTVHGRDYAKKKGGVIGAGRQPHADPANTTDRHRREPFVMLKKVTCPARQNVWR